MKPLQSIYSTTGASETDKVMQDKTKSLSMQKVRNKVQKEQNERKTIVLYSGSKFDKCYAYTV